MQDPTCHHRKLAVRMNSTGKSLGSFKQESDTVLFKNLKVCFDFQVEIVDQFGGLLWYSR